VQQKIKLGEMANCDHCSTYSLMVSLCEQCNKVGYCSKQCVDAAVKEASHFCEEEEDSEGYGFEPMPDTPEVESEEEKESNEGSGPN